jgi:Reverse transcriptase (RNA-dependent DNA polymerase)
VQSIVPLSKDDEHVVHLLVNDSDDEDAANNAVGDGEEDELPPLADVPDDVEGDGDDHGDADSGGEGGTSSSSFNSSASSTPASSHTTCTMSGNGVRRSGRVSRPPSEWWKAGDNTASANVVSARICCDEPQSLKEALSSDVADKWKAAMQEEISSLQEYGTWTVEPLPAGVEPIPCKWVFKIKRNAQGRDERYKARLVAKGFRQVEGVDYDEVYAPVSNTTLQSWDIAISCCQGRS